MKLPLLSNSRGHRDFLMTASALALAVVLGKVALNGATIYGQTMGVIDAALVAALLAPTFGAYTAKRIGVKDPAP